MTLRSRGQDRRAESRGAASRAGHAKAGKPGASKLNNLRPTLNGHLLFLRGFLKHPREVASVVPSSRFVEQRIVKLAAVGAATSIVELGPGTGGTTRAILRSMPQDARLLSVEINPVFHALLGRLQDPRFNVHLGSAEELRELLAHYDMPAPQAIISGIPFSTMSRSVACRILKAIAEVLPTGGRFVAYQVRDHVHRLCRPYLGPARVEVELLNIPPLRVFQWEKNGVPRTAYEAS
jgi:phosphatidylethanolamine/phosphatidyl-N-methylethanolamine N-methyltransferase